MNPEIYALSVIQWQLFASLTFKSAKLADGVRMKMFFALMRKQAKNFGVHFKKTIWCLRTEAGETTGRLHLHALIAGFPEHAVTKATCFSFMKLWEKLGGGMARVTVYKFIPGRCGLCPQRLRNRISAGQRGLLRDPKVRETLRRHAFRVGVPRIGGPAANREETPSRTTPSGVRQTP
jgi:hypothetical protein